MRSVRFVDPSSSRGGRRFEPVQELELHELVEAVAATLPGRGDVLVVPEMPSPLGLPDFVAAVGVDGWMEARMDAGLSPILSEIECAVLAATSPTRPLAVSTIARRVGWSVPEARNVVVRLVRADAMLQTTSGLVVAHPALRPTGTLFAVEAKLKKWQRALLQGRTYRTWADNYVVVLGDVGVTAQSRAAKRIAEDGGGLFTQSGWLVHPRSRQPFPARRIQAFEHLFAAMSSSPALGTHEKLEATQEWFDPVVGSQS